MSVANPTAAYGAVVSGTGPSTADTAEACSFVSGTNPNEVYQVTNTAKRVWDPSVAVVVQDGGVTVSSTLYSFNYLFGIITFAGHAVTGAITISTGNYLPVVESVLADKFDLSAKQTLVDTTNFDSGGVTQRLPTIVSAEGTWNTFDVGNTILDGVSGTIESWLANQQVLVISVRFGPGLNYFRCFAYLDDFKTSAAVAGVYETMVSWKSIIGSGLPGATFGWGQ